MQFFSYNILQLITKRFYFCCCCCWWFCFCIKNHFWLAAHTVSSKLLQYLSLTVALYKGGGICFVRHGTALIYEYSGETTYFKSRLMFFLYPFYPYGWVVNEFLYIISGNNIISCGLLLLFCLLSCQSIFVKVLNSASLYIFFFFGYFLGMKLFSLKICWKILEKFVNFYWLFCH